MSEQAQEAAPEAAAPTRAQLIQQAWAAAEAEPVPAPEAEEAAPEADAPAPDPEPQAEAQEPAITKESLNELSTKNTTSIREFLRAQQPKKEPEGLEREVQELRTALAEIRNAGKPQEQVTETQAILQELQQLRTQQAEREQAEAEARAQQEHAERERVLYQGVISNLESRKEDFPALFALGQEKSVATELFNRLSRDEDASDFSVASEFESALWELYEKLSALKTPTTSEEKTASDPKPTVTITNDMAGMDEDEDLSGLSRAQLIERAWAKARNS